MSNDLLDLTLGNVSAHAETQLLVKSGSYLIINQQKPSPLPRVISPIFILSEATQARSRRTCFPFARARKGVPHPFALFAKGWENTTPNAPTPYTSVITVISGGQFNRNGSPTVPIPRFT